MQFSTSWLLMGLFCWSTVLATPIQKPSPVPCTDEIRDAVLNGKMDKTACCATRDGLCVGSSAESNSAISFVQRNSR
ncbi:hypothetical protein GLAREA_08286 [Glarea lozoyensis ATCC 20868]|uniref:Uncharacterized protein n=1 Tax=Glarea lozoyensis (strain ATCC 20868 / MF5171) TaxID=1116229 RepID=S3CGN6_GLAL2|nr:uncharacterized protein GLAREA_08286 [Glarea lozoyensis ATCC 20868]EPE24434.1 hypothetical protein GLAREA_08286 [Glarea lozoyensis ATCC 20868]